MAAVLTAALSSTSCTIGKPVVCALTAPVYVLGQFDGCPGDGRAALCLACCSSIVGVFGGLITGIVSDISYLAGETDDPFRNWHHPFATSVEGDVGW